MVQKIMKNDKANELVNLNNGYIEIPCTILCDFFEVWNSMTIN